MQTVSAWHEVTVVTANMSFQMAQALWIELARRARTIPTAQRTMHTVCLDANNTVFLAIQGDATSDSVCKKIGKCRAGTYLDEYPKYKAFNSTHEVAVSDVLCKSCQAGKYTVEDNSIECIPFTTCEVGSCIKVQGNESFDQVCSECPFGKFTRRKNAPKCIPNFLVPLYFLYFFVPFSLLLFISIFYLVMHGQVKE